MQGDLFSTGTLAFSNGPDLPLQREQLLAWQERLHSHQAPLFRGESAGATQGDLFGSDLDDVAAAIDPLALTPLAMSFWRWPEPSHRGAAIYLVMDRPTQLEHPLLLYVGETLAAERRWKGDHDCKAYLAAYGEALQRCELSAQLSIRFSCDVPRATRARRALEQQLIQRWWPPFNKETRQRWATPFTADL
ncbi:GIY-YIG nuclease family protein [Synechococcus sp. MU1642]|uniref:GIY-YIG nuclease family protein n=1 Tax=Synechococcus sp. MU1642 TaxID=2508348 RepID=UPI001CF8DFF5|nr:GIY-YIG nuclease family protein [Synechococcus sp. MU1642]MCB4407402.1 GIY-YIG nuclease family protein [Synechococcus sp. MU1642]